MDKMKPKPKGLEHLMVVRNKKSGTTHMLRDTSSYTVCGEVVDLSGRWEIVDSDMRSCRQCGFGMRPIVHIDPNGFSIVDEAGLYDDEDVNDILHHGYDFTEIEITDSISAWV